MIRNPYPGLRPFSENEEEIFFGREEQIEGLIRQLEKSHFLAVLGASGCGKSSLVRAGLLPALDMGFMLSAGNDWRVARMQPGGDPMGNLAEALAEQAVLGELREADGPHAAATILATLERGPLGLLEVLKETPLAGKGNLLVLVDQFEEIFRYSEQVSADSAVDFVNLLMASVGGENKRVYVAVTMRSDYYGHCDLFPGLPELLNTSQFLTPRLTRDQLRAAIVGPASILGGTIEPALVNRLLNETGSKRDQLPVLQHCLMRLWREAQLEAEKSNRVAITLDDYEKIGGLQKALSDHADKVYEDLSPEQQTIAEVLFRRLSGGSENRSDTRDVVKLKDVSVIAGVGDEKARKVVQEFSREGRNFLLHRVVSKPKPGEYIDISHESLIRLWNRLEGWVKAEAVSATTYRRLEEKAESYEKKGDPRDTDEAIVKLWSPQDLENTIDWRNKEKPTKSWAKRYGDNFDLAEKFLARSEKARDNEWDREEKERERELIKTKNRLYITLFLLFFIVLFAGWGFLERSRANKEKTARTQSLYNSNIIQASLLDQMGNYPAAREVLKIDPKLEKDITQKRRHIRNLLAWCTELMSGSEKKIYEHATDKYNSAAISRDGRYLAAVGQAGALVLLDMKNGSEIKWITRHNSETGKDEAILDVVFDPETRWLATAHAHKKITKWSLSGNRTVQEWKTPFAVATLTVSPDGKILAGGGADSRVILWNSENGEEKAIFSGKQTGVSDIVFCPAGRSLACASSDGTVCIWNLNSKSVEKNPMIHAGKIVQVAFHPTDGSLLATANSLGLVQLWDVNKGKQIPIFMGHAQAVHGLAFVANGRYLASGSFDHTIRVWDMNIGEAFKIFPGRKPGLRNLVFHGGRVFSVGTDGVVRSWTIHGDGDDWKRKVIDTKNKHPFSSSFSRDGRTVAVGYMDGSIELFSFPELEMTRRIQNAHDDSVVRCLDFSPDGNTLASGGRDAEVKIWTIKDGALKKSFEDLEKDIYSISFSPCGKIVAAADSAGQIGLFHLEGEQTRPFKATRNGKAVYSLAFGENGNILFSAAEDGQVASWDLRTPSPYKKEEYTGLPSKVFRSTAHSPDGKLLAVVGDDSLVHLFNTSDRKELRPLSGHGGKIIRARFSPDGAFLVTAGEDATVRFWDLEKGRELFKIRLPTRAFDSANNVGIPVWDFDFLCTASGDCQIVSPLIDGKLVFYQMKGVYKNQAHP